MPESRANLVGLACSASALTFPSRGRLPAGYGRFQPPLMSNVTPPTPSVNPLLLSKEILLNAFLLLALVVAALLSGCGTLANGASVALVPRTALTAERTGVVLVSTGAPEHCVSMATFLKVFDVTSKKPVDGSPLVPVDVYVNKSEFSDHHGTINGLVLPVGNYYVSPWTANPYVTPIKTPAFGFEVRPGETTYIGELFMTRSCGLNTTFVVKDEYDRDIRLAMEKNPLLAQRTPIKRLMQPTTP